MFEYERTEDGLGVKLSDPWVYDTDFGAANLIAYVGRTDDGQGFFSRVRFRDPCLERYGESEGFEELEPLRIWLSLDAALRHCDEIDDAIERSGARYFRERYARIVRRYFDDALEQRIGDLLRKTFDDDIRYEVAEVDEASLTAQVVVEGRGLRHVSFYELDPICGGFECTGGRTEY